MLYIRTFLRNVVINLPNVFQTYSFPRMRMHCKTCEWWPDELEVFLEEVIPMPSFSGVLPNIQISIRCNVTFQSGNPVIYSSKCTNSIWDNQCPRTALHVSWRLTEVNIVRNESKSEKCTVKDYLTFSGWGSKGTFNKCIPPNFVTLDQ